MGAAHAAATLQVPPHAQVVVSFSIRCGELNRRNFLSIDLWQGYSAAGVADRTLERFDPHLPSNAGRGCGGTVTPVANGLTHQHCDAPMNVVFLHIPKTAGKTLLAKPAGHADVAVGRGRHCEEIGDSTRARHFYELACRLAPHRRRSFRELASLGDAATRAQCERKIAELRYLPRAT